MKPHHGRHPVAPPAVPGRLADDQPPVSAQVGMGGGGEAEADRQPAQGLPASPVSAGREAGDAVSKPVSYQVIDGMQRLNAIFSYIEHGFLLDGQCFDINGFAPRQAADRNDFKTYLTHVPRLPAQECADMLDYQLAITIFPGAQATRIMDVFGRISWHHRQRDHQCRSQRPAENERAHLAGRDYLQGFGGCPHSRPMAVAAVFSGPGMLPARRFIGYQGDGSTDRGGVQVFSLKPPPAPNVPDLEPEPSPVRRPDKTPGSLSSALACSAVVFCISTTLRGRSSARNFRLLAVR